MRVTGSDKNFGTFVTEIEFLFSTSFVTFSTPNPLEKVCLGKLCGQFPMRIITKYKNNRWFMRFHAIPKRLPKLRNQIYVTTYRRLERDKTTTRCIAFSNIFSYWWVILTRNVQHVDVKMSLQKTLNFLVNETVSFETPVELEENQIFESRSCISWPTTIRNLLDTFVSLNFKLGLLDCRWREKSVKKFSPRIAREVGEYKYLTKA